MHLKQVSNYPVPVGFQKLESGRPTSRLLLGLSVTNVRQFALILLDSKCNILDSKVFLFL